MTTAAARPTRSTRVLLADDSEGLRLLVRTWLSGVDDLEVVAEASNGAEAVELVDAHRPDVVVLDVAMPVMDGLQALTELHERFPALPVVMLSGFAERDVADQAARRGAFAFVEKSGDLDPLVEVVRRAALSPVPAPRPVPPPERPAPAAGEEPAAAPAAVTPTPPPPAPGGRGLPSWLPTALALVMALALVVWRVADDDARAPILLLLTVPILVVAVRHGLVVGLAAALTGSAVYGAWAVAADPPGISLLDHTVRLVVFTSVAAVAGDGFDRLRRVAERERRGNEAVVAANRRLAETNEQLARVNAELAATNADLRQFGYVVSHDLAEPLRTMSSFAGLLERRCLDALDDDGRQYLRFVLDGADRMQALITDLRDYTRTSAADLATAPVDLGEVLREVEASLHTALAARSASVRAGCLPVVAGDRSMLGLVLQNLVSNAVKFNDADRPLVEVDAERDGADWRIRVRDNGIGIDPAHAERAFGLFTRLQAREAYPGTGLGLAITRRIVERHRGRITLAPREGGGTVVTVVLPDASPSQAQAAGPAEGGPR